jgi:hypothetical protein
VEIIAALIIVKFVITNHVLLVMKIFTYRMMVVLTVHFHALIALTIIVLIVFKDIYLMDVHAMNVQATALHAHQQQFAHCVQMDILQKFQEIV